MIDDVGSDRLVALGGGRVIDSAKAVAAVRGGEVAAIPTTLSGAPMTAFHRLPAGPRVGGAGFVRPPLVIGYADAMTSAPEPQLRATAMNALAHGAESLYTPLADAISREAALRGAELIAGALDRAGEARPRRAGSRVPCSARSPSTGPESRSTTCSVRRRSACCGTPHAETYAALLPADDGARCGPERPSRSRRWRTLWARSPTGSRSGSRSWPATAGSASWVPTAA